MKTKSKRRARKAKAAPKTLCSFEKVADRLTLRAMHPQFGKAAPKRASKKRRS